MTQSYGLNVTTEAPPELLLGDNEFMDFVIDSTGAEVDYTVGDIMGRKTANAECIQWDPDASDGSEVAVGIIHKDITVGDTDSEPVNLVVGGPVSYGGIDWDYATPTAAQIAACIDVFRDMGLYMQMEDNR